MGLRICLIALSLSSATAFAQKPTVGLAVDGPRAEELHSILYAGVANAVDLVPEEEVHAAVTRILRAPLAKLDFEPLAYDDDRLTPYRRAADEAHADTLLLVQTELVDRLHLTVRVIAVGATDKHVVLRRVFELRGKGKRPGFETFDYKPVRAAIADFATELADAARTVAAR